MTTLYVSDLDGTLLNSNQTLSPFTIQTINQLVSDGMLFSYATARSYFLMQLPDLIRQLRKSHKDYRRLFL